MSRIWAKSLVEVRMIPKLLERMAKGYIGKSYQPMPQSIRLTSGMADGVFVLKVMWGQRKIPSKLS